MTTITKQQQLLIEMVMRQTTYTFDEAKDKLENNDNNYVKVIKEALGISEPKKDNSVQSVNQHIYKEIRGMMDTASSSYRNNQEREKRKQEIIEVLKKRQLEEKNKQKKNLESVKEGDEDVESSDITDNDN
jgi:hypothetical protein